MKAARRRRLRPFACATPGIALFTEADTLDELREAVRDAVRCHFEPGTEPKVIRLHFTRDEVLIP